MAITTIDEYLAGQTPDAAIRLRKIRGILLAAVPSPEEKIRYGMPAVMLGGRYALHYAGWKKHIGLYPVPTLSDDLEREVAAHRSQKDSVVFLHSDPLPEDLVARMIAEIVALRA